MSSILCLKNYEEKLLTFYEEVDGTPTVITKSAKNEIVSFVEGDEQRMMLMGLKRFTKYTHYPNVAGLRSSIADKVNKENSYCF